MVSSVASVSRVENSCAVCCSQMALKSKFGMSLMLLDSGRSATDQRHGLYAHDNFSVLIQNFRQRPHHAAIRLGLGALGFENSRSKAQRVAGAHRAQPAQFVDPGRDRKS